MEWPVESLPPRNENPQYLSKKPSELYQATGFPELEGSILIDPGMTVTEFVNCLHEAFGVIPKILRKSGKSWVEIGVTSGWSLQEQNRQGEALSFDFES